MNIQIHTEKIELSDSQKDYIINKLEVLKKYSEKISDETVMIKVNIERNEQFHQDRKVIIKVTMTAPGASFRVEVSAITPEEGIDMVHDKLQRQIERYKAKHMSVEKVSAADLASMLESGQSKVEEGRDLRITSRKLFTDLIPMTETEAIDNMKMLGHTFFLFVNTKTDRYNLLYVRNGNQGYGLIELEQENGVIG